VIRAFLFALDPTDAQAEAFRSHCGAQRFAYNWGLALIGANLDQRAAERTYDIPDDTARADRRAGRRFDLGITSLAVLSTGQVVPNPRHLYAALTALRRVQRQASRRRGPDRRTRTVGSNRWAKTKARVAALHTRVANARRDGLHKLSTRLVREHDVVVVEDLNVAGMVRNRRLARHIAGLGVAELRRQLDYKTRDAGVRLVVADRWYPSSKTCSACGAVRAKLTLAQREFVCESCGARLDRDLNAARNLAALAAQASEPSCGRTVNEPAGNPGKTASGGNGYRHGKAQTLSQGRLREVATP